MEWVFTHQDGEGWGYRGGREIAAGKGDGAWALLALGSSRSWAGLGMGVVAHRALLSISSDQTPIHPGLPGTSVRG